METFRHLLVENPVLLLFIIAGLGYSFGQIKILGFNVGIAAILFAGLAIGAFFPELKLPEAYYRLGLVLFVYTVGLSSGPSFFASLKRKGLRDNFFVMCIILVGFVLTLLFSLIFKIKSTYASGMFAGSLTNTPALAGILEYIKEHNIHNNLSSKMISEPVVAYAVTYPIGVIGMILSIYIFQKIWKVDYKKERVDSYASSASNEKISTVTVKVTNIEIENINIHVYASKNNLNLLFGRIKRNDDLSLVDDYSFFRVNDLVSITGTQSDRDKAIKILGELSDEHLENDRSEYDFRRIFVSNPDIAGKKVSELDLNKFGAIITRIRRGDVDFLAASESVLELGDRVRVITPLKNLDQISKYFGDSYKKLSEVDVISFSLGIALGLLLGSIPFPLYQGATFKLGFAGGPLIVALILGKIRKTGKILWQIPYNTNLTLRQFGMILFLAGVGLTSGSQFVSIFSEPVGLYIFLSGLIVTFITAILTLWIGYIFLKIPMNILIGILSGLQTQPAILAFSSEQTENDLPNIGYATVYPFAMILKILLAQILLIYIV